MNDFKRQIIKHFIKYKAQNAGRFKQISDLDDYDLQFRELSGQEDYEIFYHLKFMSDNKIEVYIIHEYWQHFKSKKHAKHFSKYYDDLKINDVNVHSELYDCHEGGVSVEITSSSDFKIDTIQDPGILDDKLLNLSNQLWKKSTGIFTETFHVFLNDGNLPSPVLRFLINDFLTIKLEESRINIYVKGELFNQCKYLLLNPGNDSSQETINSIDEAEEFLSLELEYRISPQKIGLTKKEEFWGHCSNLQAWIENDYDTRLIHRNLAFPLLRLLTEAGDLVAKKVFKGEIASRFSSGYRPVQSFLIQEGYLNYLNKEELETLFNETDLEKKEYLLVKCNVGDEHIENLTALIDIKCLKPHILQKRDVFLRTKSQFEEDSSFHSITFWDARPDFYEINSIFFHENQEDKDYTIVETFIIPKIFKEVSIDTVKLEIMQKGFRWTFFLKYSDTDIYGSTYEISYDFLEEINDS